MFIIKGFTKKIINVTLSGIINDPLKFEQYWKAFSSIRETLSGIFKVPEKPEQFSIEITQLK